MSSMAYRPVFILLTLLLASGATASSQSRDDADVTALMRAARDGERSNVTALLDQGVDISAKDSYGWTALIYASAKGDASIVKALLVKGADINAKATDGFTALQAAANYGHKSVVKLLLEKGADVNAEDNNGASALASAMRKRDTGMIEILKKAGAVESQREAKSPPAVAPQSAFTRPVPLNSPEPSYTTKAQQNGVEGTSNIRVLVGADGTVRKARILTGLPYGLSYQALDAAYQLRFKPATKDGTPVAYWQTVAIEFRLRR
jgi:TonB family protein